MVRSCFAALEAHSRVLMSVARPRLLALLKDQAGGCDPDSQRGAADLFEICALADQSFEVNDRGEIDLKPLKTNLIRQLLFAIRMFSKCKGNEVFNPKEVQGWGDLQAAVKVRDRVTHPKRSEDLEVTEAEMNSAVEAYRWLVRCQKRARGTKSVPKEK